MMEMEWLDISTYIVNNSGGLILTGIFAFVGLGLFGMAGDDVIKFSTAVKTYVIGLLVISVISLTCSLFPSHEKILEVKIQKMKNEAVTRENLEQGVETIERVLKKLECKYLECEGEK